MNERSSSEKRTGAISPTNKKTNEQKETKQTKLNKQKQTKKRKKNDTTQVNITGTDKVYLYHLI